MLRLAPLPRPEPPAEAPAEAPAPAAPRAALEAPAPQGVAVRSPRQLAAAKPLPPFLDQGQVRFHDLPVHRAVEALRPPSAAPSGLLRPPELSAGRARPVSGSPRRTPYEELMGKGLGLPQAWEEATAALRHSCRPTQRAEALERPPSGTEQEKRPAERLVPHPRSARKWL